MDHLGHDRREFLAFLAGTGTVLVPALARGTEGTAADLEKTLGIHDLSRFTPR